MAERRATDADEAYADAKRRRHRARLIMRWVVLACVLTAVAIGAQQFFSNGLPAFLNRPSGIGATPPTPAPTPTPTPTAQMLVLRPGEEA
jgi:hypothetical protein